MKVEGQEAGWPDVGGLGEEVGDGLYNNYITTI